jgi:mRNA interferase MazF
VGRRSHGTGTVASGAVVLVPFPFTDLSGSKRRPAVVVSPSGFDPDDLILCAITSQLPPVLSAWEVALDAADLIGQRLPRPSVIRVSKIFTIHRGLVVAHFGRVTTPKLAEVQLRLRRLFGET